MEIFSSNNTMWLIWLAVGAFFVLLELFAPIFIVIFFGFGAFIAGAVAFFGCSIQMQLVVFGIASIVLLIVLRRFMAPIFHGGSAEAKNTQGEPDHFIGALAEVTEAITPPKRGRIKFQGSFWSVESDTSLDVGTFVRITARHPEEHSVFLVTKED